MSGADDTVRGAGRNGSCGSCRCWSSVQPGNWSVENFICFLSPVSLTPCLPWSASPAVVSSGMRSGSVTSPSFSDSRLPPSWQVPFGLLLGRAPRVQQFANLYLDLLLVIPISALIPVVMGALGVGLAARIAIVFLFSFSVIAISSASGTRSVDPSLLEMSTAFGASPLRLWTRVLIPSAFPDVMTGLRLGLARAIAGMVIVDLLMVAAGIGGLILHYQADFEAAGTYAVILATAGEAVILIKLLRKAESRVRALFR